MLRPTLLAMCIAITACTVVKINPDDTETIEYTGDTTVAKDLAARVCEKGGRPGAQIISTANKDDTLPPGSGRQIAKVRCGSVPSVPESSDGAPSADPPGKTP